MARTDGHGNPHWSSDETLLALELYLQHPDQVPGPHDPRVVQLSKTLRQLRIHPAAARKDTFRNPEGVAFKLQNLRSVATGKGLQNVSAMDKQVWNRFGKHSAEVTKLAAQIRSAAAIAGETRDDFGAEDDFEFPEGKVATKLHRARERARGLRRQVIRARLNAGPLACECCGTHGLSGDDGLQAAIFEVHHLVPLADLGERKTRLNDVCLLCANCHRAIHRTISDLGRWIHPRELSTLVAPGWGKRP